MAAKPFEPRSRAPIVSDELATTARANMWPQFKAGEVTNPVHGAYDKRRIGPIAAEFFATALAIATSEGSSSSYLIDPMYEPALRAWANDEARVMLLEQWLDEHGGMIDSKGRVKPAALYLDKVLRAAARSRARLGCDPLARSQLQFNVGAAATFRANLDRLTTRGSEYLSRFERPGADD